MRKNFKNYSGNIKCTHCGAIIKSDMAIFFELSVYGQKTGDGFEVCPCCEEVDTMVETDEDIEE